MSDGCGDEAGDRKRSTASQFGAHAAAYRDSDTHRTGDDLATLAGWCVSAEWALDVATGAGHTAGALVDAGVDHVVATDAAPDMVATATASVPAVAGVVCDAERLPFADGAFDCVTCRIAAHHFPDPAAFVREVSRVLAPGGTVAFEDNVAPADDRLDAFLNTVERLRDPTHVRSHTVADWLAWFDAAGLDVAESTVITRTLDYEAWLDRLDTPADRRDRLDALFADAPPGADDRFEVRRDDGTVESFANLKLLLRATNSQAGDGGVAEQ